MAPYPVATGDMAIPLFGLVTDVVVVSRAVVSDGVAQAKTFVKSGNRGAVRPCA